MKKLLLATACAWACAAANVHAGADSGFYVGGSIGQSDADVKITSLDFQDDNTAYKIFGGYNFGVVPFIDLAVEADYRDFGEFKDAKNQASSSVTAYDLFALAGLSFGPAGVFAKVGYCSADVETVSKNASFSSSDSFSAWGLGARVQLASFALRAEYENFDVDSYENLSMFSVGAALTF
jgi:outer membrane immunogenic protein